MRAFHARDWGSNPHSSTLVMRFSDRFFKERQLLTLRYTQIDTAADANNGMNRITAAFFPSLAALLSFPVNGFFRRIAPGEIGIKRQYL
jgi:hypothetical protein